MLTKAFVLLSMNCFCVIVQGLFCVVVGMSKDCFRVFAQGLFWLVYGVQRHFQQYFSYIVPFSFIGGGNRSTWRKQPTCHKSLTNFIT